MQDGGRTGVTATLVNGRGVGSGDLRQFLVDTPARSNSSSSPHLDLLTTFISPSPRATAAFNVFSAANIVEF